MNYVSLLETVHNRQLKARAIDRLVETDEFEKLWTKSDEQKKKDGLWFIKNQSLEQLKDWMLTHPSRDLSSLSHRELVTLAKQKGVKNYSRLLRAELIRELGYDKATKDKSDGVTNPGNETNVQESEH